MSHIVLPPDVYSISVTNQVGYIVAQGAGTALCLDSNKTSVDTDIQASYHREDLLEVYH